MSKLEAARDALDRRINDINSDIAAWESERDELGLRISEAEGEADRLERALAKLYDVDDDVIEDVIAGEVIQKSLRMQEIERISMRGRSWSEWQAINDEYQREAERQRQSLVDLIDEAFA